MIDRLLLQCIPNRIFQTLHLTLKMTSTRTASAICCQRSEEIEKVVLTIYKYYIFDTSLHIFY